MTDTQGSAGYIDLVVMGEIGEPLEDAEQVLVPEAAAGSSNCRRGTAN